MGKIKCKKILVFIALVLFLINVFFIMKNQIKNEQNYQVYNYNSSQEVVNITKDNKVTQEFKSNYYQIDAITIHTGKLNKKLSNYVLDYKILSNNKKVLIKGDIELKNIGSETDINIYFS